MVRVPFLTVLLLMLLVFSFPSRPVAAQAYTCAADVVAMAYVDLNKDGALGLTEPVLPDITIQLFSDQAPLEQWGASDTLYTSAVTNQDGWVVIRCVPAGDYFLVQVPHKDYVLLSSPSQFISVTGLPSGTVPYEFANYPYSALYLRYYYPIMVLP